MQKFKALFKRERGQRTVRGRHVDPQRPQPSSSTAVDPSAGALPPYSDLQSQSASIAVVPAGSAFVDERIDVFANGKTNGVIMEDEIQKLKKEIKKREELLAKLAAENIHLTFLVKRLPETREISSSIVGDSEQDKKSSSILEEKHIPSTFKDTHAETINDEQSSDNLPSEGFSAFEGFPSIDYDQIFISTPRPSQDLSALITTPPDVSTIRIPENSSGTSGDKSASPRDKSSSLLQPSSTGDLDESSIFQDERLNKWLKELRLTIPESLQNLSTEHSSSQTTHVSETREISSSIVGDSEQDKKSSSILEEKHIPSTFKDTHAETDVIVIESSSSEDDLIKEQKGVNEEITYEPECLREIAALAVLPLLPLPRKKKTLEDVIVIESSSSEDDLITEQKGVNEEITYEPKCLREIAALAVLPLLPLPRKKKTLEDVIVIESSSSEDDLITEQKGVNEEITYEPKCLREIAALAVLPLLPLPRKKKTLEDVIVIESSSSEDDLIKEQKGVNEEITYELKCLREIAALAVLPLLPLPRKKKTLESTSTIELDIELESTVELNSTLLAPNLSLNDTAINCGVKPQELSTASLTEELQELLVKPEIEVSQLQDHLRRMEESHYSTSEELQATIQELSDLQTQLDQTRNEKEKFREEKILLLESLFRQTERLQSAKKENENLQKLLHESASDNSVPDREKKLIELLKQGQAKRETMISQINELEHRLNEVQRAKELAEEENRCLADRVGELKVTLEDVQDEKRTLEEELVDLKEEQSSKYFEILRLNVLLDIEETKVKELKAAQASLGNENELYNMMHNVLKEKELVEKKMAESEDILKRTNCENQRLSQEINALREQLTVLKESAANAISDLENHSKLRKIEQEQAAKKIEMTENTLKDVKQQYNVLSRDLKVVTENLKITEDKLQITVTQFEDLKDQKLKEKQRRDDECAEWKQLHEDLLVAVRVANDIKTECQQQLERTQARIRELEETNATLIAQNEQYIRKEKMTLKPLDILKSLNVPKVVTSSSASATHTTIAAATKDTAIHKFSKPSLQCVNVKSLIESIENANKQTKTGQPDSCSGSKAGSPQRETNPPLPLREQPLTSNKQTQQTAPPVISVLATPADEKKDPLHSLVERNGGSKRNALLKWVQNRIQGYPNIEITNFSSSWTDGLALCALLHTYIPHKIPYNLLSLHNKQHNFGVAFSAAESVGIPTILNMNDMTQQERPDWQKVMAYVKEIYTHFEGRDTI